MMSLTALCFYRKLIYSKYMCTITLTWGRSHSQHVFCFNCSLETTSALSYIHCVSSTEKVPKPVVTRLPCDSNSTSCEVHCLPLRGDITESGPVTYLWKKDEGEWMVSDSGPNSNRLIVTRDKDGKVKTLTCEVKNVFSMERSNPGPNYLYHEGM